MLGVVTYEVRQRVPWYVPMSTLVTAQLEDNGFGGQFYHVQVVVPSHRRSRQWKKTLATVVQLLRAQACSSILVQEGFAGTAQLAEEGFVTDVGTRFYLISALQAIDRAMSMGRMDANVLVLRDDTKAFIDEEWLKQFGQRFHTLIITGGGAEQYEQLAHCMMEEYGIPILLGCDAERVRADCALAAAEGAQELCRAHVPVLAVGRGEQSKGVVTGYTYQLSPQQLSCIPQHIPQQEFLGTLWEREGVEGIAGLKLSSCIENGKKHTTLWGKRGESLDKKASRAI